MKLYYILGLLSLLTYSGFAQTATPDNTVYGYGAGQSINGNSQKNTFIGVNAGRLVTVTDNTFIGHEAGSATTGGYGNTFLGSQAGHNNTTGVANVFIGINTGSGNTTGQANMFIGQSAGGSNTAGNYNVYMGNAAGANTTSGDGNVFVGDGSGYGNATGYNNTYIGRWAGLSSGNTGGSNNVYIGVASGAPAGTGTLTNSVAIGSNAFVTASNAIVLGGTGTYAVNVGIGVTNPTYRLTVNGTVGAREVNVTTETWSDFVFEKAYKLPSLRSIERYINAQKHLPDIPSAAEVTQYGYGLGAMDAKLLQKIEELTLYAIEQQKQIDALKTLIGQLLPVKP